MSQKSRKNSPESMKDCIQCVPDIQQLIIFQLMCRTGKYNFILHLVIKLQYVSIGLRGMPTEILAILVL